MWEGKIPQAHALSLSPAAALSFPLGSFGLGDILF